VNRNAPTYTRALACRVATPQTIDAVFDRRRICIFSSVYSADEIVRIVKRCQPVSKAQLLNAVLGKFSGVPIYIQATRPRAASGGTRCGCLWVTNSAAPPRRSLESGTRQNCGCRTVQRLRRPISSSGTQPGGQQWAVLGRHQVLEKASFAPCRDHLSFVTCYPPCFCKEEEGRKLDCFECISGGTLSRRNRDDERLIFERRDVKLTALDVGRNTAAGAVAADAGETLS